MTRASIYLTLLLVGPACKDRPEQSADESKLAPTQVAPPIDAAIAPAPEDPLPPDTESMQKHFAHAITVKDTVLFGDLDVAMESLKWISENGASDSNNDSWEPHMGRVRSIAKNTLGHKKVEVMAMAVAQLARECGACHATLGVEPEIPVVNEVPQGDEFRDHMIGHKWALDRMWAGLTNPSDALWLSGAKFLAGKPSHLRNLSEYGDDADMAMTYATRVHSLAEEAVNEPQGDRRMAIFGRFLAACAGCHAFPASRPGR
jgi:hypothetical protein